MSTAVEVTNEEAPLVPMSDVEIESQTLSLSQQCRTLKVVDQESYDLAVNVREAAKELLTQATQYFDDLRIPAYRAYQAVLDKQNAVIPKLKDDIKLIGRELVVHEQRMKAEEERVRREAAERQRQELAERQLEAAVEAEAAGFDEASVEAIINEPVQPTTPAPVQRVFVPSAAISTRENWSGEVHDFWALVKYVAKHKSEVGLLLPNESGINAKIRGLVKAGTPNLIPGVKAVNNPVVASKRRSR